MVCNQTLCFTIYLAFIAHCVEEIEMRPDLLARFYAAAGVDHQLNRTLLSSGNFKQVQSVYKNPHYFKNQSGDEIDISNDIGVIRLMTRFEFGTETGIPGIGLLID